MGHFCNTIRLLFLSVILDAILELPGTSVVPRWRPDDGQARVRVLFRTRLLRVVEMVQYAQHHGMARRIQLPPAFPPPCPKQIPQDSFWVPWAVPGFHFGRPWAPPGRFLVPFGTSWSPLGPLLVPGRKNRRKVTWRTLALGSKLGLKIVTFPLLPRKKRQQT